MLRLKKKIVSFNEEKYKDLPYGAVYYIASKQNIALNDYVKRNADAITKKLEMESSVWISIRLVYLESENEYINSHGNAAFYSALIPYQTYPQPKYDFFAAYAEIFSSRYFWDAIHTYVQHLQEMLDEALEGRIDESKHINKSDYIFTDEERPEFSFGGPLFSITSKPFDYTELSRLVITDNAYRFMLSDYHREIKFNTQAKAIYTLFLLHPDGIRLKDIDDHRQEFTRLYLIFTTRSDKDKVLDSINKLLDITKPEALHVKKSQCNKAINAVIPKDDLRKPYKIEANYGLPHKINLDRSLVIMPDILRAKD